mmetsp:Transcript_48511/g.118147  ORF Transcript_48511/g.118147 Transcript_48511/m.118147 type:complete len:113 (+) Transcript_48511:67-405(+)
MPLGGHSAAASGSGGAARAADLEGGASARPPAAAPERPNHSGWKIWTKDDVCNWLFHLDFGDETETYQRRFRKEGVTGADLKTVLRDSILLEWGWSTFHRMKLLAYIQELPE